MRQVTRKSLITVAAATGVLAVTGGYAHADSGASGSSSDSPGVLSGNSVQAPVHVPVNACGNTVNVIGLLNPAAGNSCANTSGQPSGGGAQASGRTSDSPGVGSGNDVQVPVDVPVSACGNSVTVGGLGNTTTGNECGNSSSSSTAQPPARAVPPAQPSEPGKPRESTGKPAQPSTSAGETPRGSSHPNHPDAQAVTPPMGSAQLAHTGSGLPVGMVLPVGAGAILAGAVLYRKTRSAA